MKPNENTKVTITVGQLKKLVREARVSPDAEYQSFKGELFSCIAGGDVITRNALKSIIDRQLGKGWECYSSDRNDMITLNVKGKGWGDWDKFNRDGRAEKNNFDVETYYSLIRQEQEDFYNGWDQDAQNKFGLDLFAEGRSAGHWGFSLTEVCDHRNISKILQLRDDGVRRMYDRARAEIEDFGDDAAYDVAENMTDDEVAECVEFTPEFVEFCKEFQNAVDEESERWESDEWNDNQFDDYGEHLVENTPTTLTFRELKRIVQKESEGVECDRCGNTVHERDITVVDDEVLCPSCKRKLERRRR